MSFAEQLRNELTKQGMSQTELCRRTGINKSSVSLYLSDSREPDAERKKIIACALGLEEGYFEQINDTGEPIAHINVQTAARLMGKSIPWVQQGLQQGILPFGYAVKLGKWSYFISATRFTEETGIQVPKKARA